MELHIWYGQTISKSSPVLEQMKLELYIYGVQCLLIFIMYLVL